VRLPRAARPLVEPVSRADAPYHRSGAFYVRLGALAAVALALLGLLALRLWSLQVLQGPEFAKLATQQSFRIVDLPAARGAIVDRKGRLLAGTNGEVVVAADAGVLGELDADGRWRATEDGLRQLARFGELARIPLPVLVSRIERSVVRSPFAPAVVLERPTGPLAFYVDEHQRALPGLRVQALPVRSYPQGGLGSEFLGLLGEVSPRQLTRKTYSYAKPGWVIGQSGVEATYDHELNGGFRRAKLRVDSRGRIVGPLLTPAGKPLPTLRLTIDAKLQRAAVKAVQDGIGFAHAAGHGDAAAGAAVVMNAKTGALYALASYPSYNQLLAAHDPAYFERLLHASPTSTPLLNRATQGLYPTGSTFKPIVAEAALATGMITPATSLLCSGSFTIGGFTFHNVEAGVFSYMSLPTALAESCDTWFYRLGDLLYTRNQGLAIQNWAHKLGVGRRNRLDMPGEARGVVPTPRWLKRTWNQDWYEGQTINLAIGQGYLAVTPLQLAVAYAALANGGKVVRPHLARALAGKRLAYPPQRRVRMTSLDAIHEGLYEASHSAGGTSTSIFGNFYPAVSGKTGTAETPYGSDHSWYASWAPSDNPRFVVVVLIEHGGFGAQAAAPAAREIYQAIFHGPKGKKTGGKAAPRVTP
jgi:penicillin-binding protein 2